VRDPACSRARRRLSRGAVPVWCGDVVLRCAAVSGRRDLIR